MSLRLALVILGFFGFFLLIAVRLVEIQFLRKPEFEEAAKRQQKQLLPIGPERGTISDRHGRVLGVDLRLSSVYAVPHEIREPKKLARELAPLLDLRTTDLVRRLRSKKPFVWVKRTIDVAQARSLKEKDLRGVHFLPENRRFYPQRSLAAHLLGGVGIDNQGLAGIEYSLNEWLAGKPGKLLVPRDARGTPYLPRHIVVRGPRRGNDLRLSLDLVIQHEMEQSLEKTVQRHRADWGAALLMDPWTGEIIALANVPRYNPNRIRSYTDRRWWNWVSQNHAVTTTYEPGSTFKVIIAAAALEGNWVGEEEAVYCEDGSIVVRGVRIRDHKPFSRLSFREIIEQSSNVGMIKIGDRIPEEDFYRFIRRCGFGRQTGVEISGESSGLIRAPKHWSGISQAELSIGQELSVTPLQMVRALAAVANGGYLVSPTVVRVTDRMSQQQGRQRVFSSRTASLLADMLVGVVEHGTGRKARMNEYTMAGKTGTAQQIGPEGRYSEYVASFMGFAPAEQPALAGIVVIDSPRTSHYGGEVAAPAFREMMQSALRLLRVPPSREENRWRVARGVPRDHQLSPLLLTWFRGEGHGVHAYRKP